MSESKEQERHLALLESISGSLTELLTWTRAMGYARVKQTLDDVLDTDDKRLVYHLMDGQRVVAEIERLARVNARYISEWGQEWERIGIATGSRRSSVKGRRERAFDLGDFGIKVPAVDR